MKKIIALVLAALMILSLAACTTTGSEGGSSTPSGPITIKVWTPTEDQAEGNNWLAAMQAKFEAAHPEWDITWENSTMGEGDAGNAVIADVTSSADVFMFANDQLGSLVNAGGLSKLVGDYKAQITNDNVDFMKNTVTHTDGEFYGFPVTNNTWFMYYDNTVFSAEDVKNLDTMLTKGKVYLPFGTGWTAGCIFLGCGATIFGEAGNDEAAGIDFGGAKGYTAAKKMIELKQNANAVCGGMDISKLTTGEVSATFSGSWDAANIKAALGDKMGVAMLPKFSADGNEYQMTAMSGSKCVGVNPNSGAVEGKQEIATAFAAFLASEEAQLARYEMRGVIPAHKDLVANEKIQKDAVAVAEMMTIANASKLQTSLEELSNYWGPVENFGGKVVTGDITMDTVEIAVDEMQEALNP
jgi:arabinogalactan oligomer/maltooligosaccharide transport system substrate-binding protein